MGKFIDISLACACCAAVLLSAPGCAASNAVAEKDATTGSRKQNAYEARGAYQTSVRYETWADEERGRSIDIKIYAPATQGPAPVVIFSHGLGGSVEAAPYIGAQLSSHGFLSVHIQHPGSDAKVWRGLTGRDAIMGALRDAARDPATAINRFNDIPFVIDQIRLRNLSGELSANIDRIGIAGHSFGAHTVLAALGRRYPAARGRVGDFKEPRLRAGLALSPPSPGPRVQPEDYAFVYGEIDRPILHITGTDDENPLNENDPPVNRTIPFEQINGAPQYLIVFDGADHAVFGGGSRRRAKAWYPEVQARTAEAATVFFKAYLLDDPDARKWLNEQGAADAFAEGAQLRRR